MAETNDLAKLNIKLGPTINKDRYICPETGAHFEFNRMCTPRGRDGWWVSSWLRGCFSLCALWEWWVWSRRKRVQLPRRLRGLNQMWRWCPMTGAARSFRSATCTRMNATHTDHRDPIRDQNWCRLRVRLEHSGFDWIGPCIDTRQLHRSDSNRLP